MIAGLIGQEKFESQRALEVIKKAWKEISGDFIRSNTRVVSFENGVLKISARTGAFVFQLKSMKEQYISGLNRLSAPFKIRDIEFRAGKLLPDSASPGPARPDVTRDDVPGDEGYFDDIENIEVPDDVMASIKAFIESVGFSDGEIREKALRATVDFYRIGQAKRKAGYVECGVCRVLFKPAGERGVCSGCVTRLRSALVSNRRRIVTLPQESYEEHAANLPGISFGEYSFIREEEFARARMEAESFGRQYISSEDGEIFKKLSSAVRLGLSLRSFRNYLTADKFSDDDIKAIGDHFGPATKAVFIRGMLVAKI